MPAKSCHLYINSPEIAFEQTLLEEAESTARELHTGGFSISVQARYARGDAAEQQKQIERDRTSPEPPDLCVVIPVDQATIYPLVSEIVRKQGDVTAVFLQQPLTAMLRSERETYKERLFSVVADQAEIGHIQARQLASLLPHATGDILYVQGAEHSYATHQRMKGMAVELTRTPLLKLNGRRLFGDWTPGSVPRAIESWKELGGKLDWIQAAAAQNDDMAVALAEYLRNDGYEIPVTGVDGLAFGRRAVDSATLSATVLQPTGVGTALRIFRDLCGGVPERDLIPSDGNVLLVPESYPSLEDLRLRRAAVSVAGAGVRSMRT